MATLLKLSPGNPPADVAPDSHRTILRLAFVLDHEAVAEASKAIPTLVNLDGAVNIRLNSSAAASEMEGRALTPVVDPIAVGRYKEARSQITSQGTAAEKRATEIEARISKLRGDRDRTAEDLTAPDLASKLVKLDREIAAANRELADIAAERAVLEPLVEKLRPAAEQTVKLVASEALSAASNTLAVRRAELVSTIAKKCNAELAELFAVIRAGEQLANMSVPSYTASQVHRVLGAAA